MIISSTRFLAFRGLLLPALLLMSGCGGSTSPSDSSIAPPTGARLMTYDYFLRGIRVSTLGDSVAVLVEHLNDSTRGPVVLFSARTRVPQFVQYRPNGDLAIRQTRFAVGPITVPEHWLRLPFGSKVPIRVRVIDTAYNSGGGIDSLRVTWTTSFKGPDVTMFDPQDFIVIGNQTFSALRAVATRDVRLKHIGIGAPTDVTTTTETNSWYSPAVGCIVQEETYRFTDDGKGRKQVGEATGWVATSYQPNN